MMGSYSYFSLLSLSLSVSLSLSLSFFFLLCGCEWKRQKKLRRTLVCWTFIIEIYFDRIWPTRKRNKRTIASSLFNRRISEEHSYVFDLLIINLVSGTNTKKRRKAYLCFIPFLYTDNTACIVAINTPTVNLTCYWWDNSRVDKFYALAYLLPIFYLMWLMTWENFFFL